MKQSENLSKSNVQYNYSQYDDDIAMKSFEKVNEKQVLNHKYYIIV